MAWDSSRPVPWQRLIREWLIYVVIMAAIFYFLFRNNLTGAFAGLLISGPLYLTFGFVLAKFGYQRRSFKDLRAERAATAAGERTTVNSPGSTPPTDGERERPAATGRTSTGRGRPGTKPNRRKR